MFRTSREGRNASGTERDIVARKVRVTGRVQGVGYRYWAASRAEELALRGYVRNLTDGSVEALLIGEPMDVARMLALCSEGPLDAVVARVETSPPEPSDKLDLQGFRRAATGDPGSPPR